MNADAMTLVQSAANWVLAKGVCLAQNGDEWAVLVDEALGRFRVDVEELDAALCVALGLNAPPPSELRPASLFEAVGLVVVTDPAELERVRAMRGWPSCYESEDKRYAAHLAPMQGPLRERGWWQWSVRRHDNFEHQADAAGVQASAAKATEAMTSALRSLCGNVDANWRPCA